MKMTFSSRHCVMLTACILTLSAVHQSPARPVYHSGKYSEAHSGVNNRIAVGLIESAAHNIGELYLPVANNGTFGSLYDNAGFEGPNVSRTLRYPIGSGFSYMFQGSFWVGGVLHGDTLVSAGQGPYFYYSEFAYDPKGKIPDDMDEFRIRRMSSSPHGATKSELDITAVYYDTSSEIYSYDFIDGRLHKPLGVQVDQSTYSWSGGYAEDIVIFNMRITNINDTSTIDSLYFGIYKDDDIVHAEYSSGYGDDMTGLHRASAGPAPGYPDCRPRLPIEVMWSADQDGVSPSTFTGPFDGFTYSDPRGAIGLVFLRDLPRGVHRNYNWWAYTTDSTNEYFGPKQAPTAEYPARDSTQFVGLPRGDRDMYYCMARPEVDYDFLTTFVDHTAEGWLPVTRSDYPPDAVWDILTLYSEGPYTLAPGEYVDIPFAVVMTDDLHTDPNAMYNWWDPLNPDPYRALLNFRTLVRHARTAKAIYDNPGVDTDEDGYSGEYTICCQYIPYLCDTTYYSGDGIPDFNGLSAPPVPDVEVSTIPGAITLRWNGLRSETKRDYFTGMRDFEGYRVYIGAGDQPSELSLIESFDYDNFLMYAYDTAVRIWLPAESTLTTAEIAALAGETDTLNFDPLIYGKSNLLWDGAQWVYFTKSEYNNYTVDDETRIHKPARYRYNYLPNGDVMTTENGDTLWTPYPHTLDIRYAYKKDTFLVNQSGDTTWYMGGELTEDGKRFKYFEYEYTISDLNPLETYYVSVSAFDWGAPQSGLQAYESPKTLNVVGARPTSSSANPNPEVLVVPNPVYIDIDPEFDSRGITFNNLPEECEVSVYTLDGDVIWLTEHSHPPGATAGNYESWDGRARSNRTLKPGIYYWAVSQPNGRSQLGKLVIIR